MVAPCKIECGLGQLCTEFCQSSQNALIEAVVPLLQPASDRLASATVCQNARAGRIAGDTASVIAAAPGRQESQAERWCQGDSPRGYRSRESERRDRASPTALDKVHGGQPAQSGCRRTGRSEPSVFKLVWIGQGAIAQSGRFPKPSRLSNAMLMG